MGILLDILGVVGFVGVVCAGFRRRLVWLWRPGYVVSAFGSHRDGGLGFSLIGRNGGPGNRYITHISLAVTQDFHRFHKGDDWASVLFIPEHYHSTAFVIAEGDSVHDIRLRLQDVYGRDGQVIDHFPSAENERNIVRSIFAWGNSLEFRLSTSEGVVSLNGHSLNNPIANETFSLWRRISRIV